MSTSNLKIQIDKEINEQEIPSSLKSEKYNKVTIAAIEEGKKIAKDPNAKGYHKVSELKKELESWSANKIKSKLNKHEKQGRGLWFFVFEMPIDSEHR